MKGGGTGFNMLIHMLPIRKVFFYLFLVTLQLTPFLVSAQEMPLKTEKVKPVHSVGKAAAFSAALPGLGQAYNKKYWKIPIIYAGFGVFSYFVITNNGDYKDFREAFLYVANGDTTYTDNPYVDKYNQTQLQDAMEYYRRNRDLSIILGCVWYALNILEAYVDAHFFDYDISEDLTLRISPAAVSIPVYHIQPAPGIKVAFKF
jgi:hypothetical protein